MVGVSQRENSNEAMVGSDTYPTQNCLLWGFGAERSLDFNSSPLFRWRVSNRGVEVIKTSIGISFYRLYDSHWETTEIECK